MPPHSNRGARIDVPLTRAQIDVLRRALGPYLSDREFWTEQTAGSAAEWYALEGANRALQASVADRT